nr:hypothetical protein [Brucella anthropi]
MSNYKKRKEGNRVNDLSDHLKGLPNNQWGGHKNTTLSAKGTFGPANKGRILQQHEWKNDEARYLKRIRELDEKAGRTGLTYRSSFNK